MAVFAPDERSWHRIDYFAVVMHGFASVAEQDASDCRHWLTQRRYEIVDVDCAPGFSSVCRRLSELFNWMDQFGYEYSGQSLDALSDGFEFDVPDAGGLVLVLRRFDLLFKEEPVWAAGLLEIASQYSRSCLAAGRRFFTILIEPRDAERLGKPMFGVQVPVWWLPGPQPPFR